MIEIGPNLKYVLEVVAGCFTIAFICWALFK